MVGSVMITGSIINEKQVQVADQEAQSLANIIGYSIIETIGSIRTNPGLEVTKKVDIPRDIGGLSYYIDIAYNCVYVNSTNGFVSETSTIYNANELNIGINSEQIKSGCEKINISYKEPDYVYKFDFGYGNSFTHSPVESGYFMVTNQNPEDDNWLNIDYPYRISINVSNPTSEEFDDKVFTIMLNKNNFNYQFAEVDTYYDDVQNSHKIDSNLKIVDSGSQELSYFIDHWNPDGVSIILIRMNISANNYENIYIYYMDQKEPHKIKDISEFCDIFDSIDGSIWNINGGPICGGGKATFPDGNYITTQDKIIDLLSVPASGKTNYANYTVDVKLELGENAEADLFILSKDVYSNDCYMSYVINETTQDQSQYSISKYDSGFQDLEEKSISLIDNWIRLKCNLYLCKTGYAGSIDEASVINSCLYDITNYELIGSISAYDTKPDNDDNFSNDPLQNNKIGIGCGIKDGTLNDPINVDWIRLLNTSINQPIFRFGPIEAINDVYKWDDNYIGLEAENQYNILTPFNLSYPGPLLSDFVNDDTNRDFIISNLPGNADGYTIKITAGRYNALCDKIFISEGGDIKASFDQILAGEFVSKWFHLDWDSEADLTLTFSSSSSNEWTVNSILIERGKRGIKILEG